jgi:predicted ATPase
MLAKDYTQRLSSMRQAAAELEAIRAGNSSSSNGQAENGLHSPWAVHTPAVDHLPTTAAGRLVEFPAQRTPLIGRETDLAHLHALLSNPDCRLITLVGTGGIGKTRLAVEAAARFVHHLPDGAVFINLAPVNEAEYLIPTFANALHLRFTPGSEAKDQLLNRLCDSSMLLVLDNFEHLIESADLVAEILAAAPQVRLLVTSRERLNLQEEWLYEVNGLPYPPPSEPVPGGAESWLKNFSAVQLFVERARRADPNLPVDEAALAEIIRICQLVEGMPLALELAAPWVRAMTCAEIVQELEHGFDILSTSMRNLPERHRSVRMVFDQSWQTLSPHEQSVLARMSAFHNGCTREAAEKVAGARPGLLIALVDKALLRYRGSRFEMHELVRQYATERLDQDVPMREETYDRHHRYYLELVAQMSPWLKGGRQVEAAQTMNTDIDNIRWGWRRALQREDRQAVLQAAEAYWLYNEFRGTLAQGEAAFRKAAEKFPPQQDDLVLAGFVRAAQGSLLARQWKLARGRELMEEGVRLLLAAEPTDPEKTAFALAWFAFLLVMRGKYIEAVQLAQESLAYFPQTGDRWTQAGALRLLGAASLYQGQLQRAQEYLDQCVEVCKAIGELRIRTYATSNLGAVYLWYGQLDRARQYFDESLRVSLSCNDRLARADALCEHSRLFLATGEFERAVDTARSCITIYRQLGRSQVSLANIVLGKALRMSKQPGAEEALNEGLAAARSVEQQPDIATGLEGMGILSLDRQEYAQAEQYFREALDIWTEVGNEPEIGMLLCRSAHGLLASGSADIARVRAQFYQALQLSHKHLVGTIALSAMVGLCAAQLHTGEGETSRVAATLLLAQRHPATPQEVRGWAKQLLEKLPAQLVAEESPESQAISWQTLAERWEGEQSPAGD